MTTLTSRLNFLPALAASILAAATGCSLIKVNGKSAGSSSPASSTTSSESPPAGAAGGQASTPGDAEPDLVKVYMGVNWKDFDPTGYNGSGVVAQSGLKLGSIQPRGPRMGKPLYAISPDTTWLPGWDARGGSRDLEMALAQAGINRTWQAQCFDDYKAYRAGWKQLDAAFRPKLELTKSISNLYTKADALRDLYVELGIEATKAKLELDRRHPGHWAGIRWDIASALFDTTTKREFARDEILGPVGADLTGLLASGRAWSSDDAFERDAFCAGAQQFGTHKSPKLPMPTQPDWDFSGVRFPVTQQRADEIAKKVAATSRPTMAKVEPTTLAVIADGTTPTLALFSRENPFVIERVATKDGQTVILATSTSENAIGYDCRSTNTIESYNGDAPVYGKKCKTGTEVNSFSVEVTFAELPATAAPKVGNAIAFYGDVTKKTTSSKTERGGALQTHRRDLTVDGRYFIGVRDK